MTTLQREQAQTKSGGMYLFNLVFYLLPVFFVDYTTVQLVVIGAVLVVFVPLYFWAFRSEPQRVWLPALLIWALASLVAPLNNGAIALFAYAGFFTGFAYRLRISVPILLGQIAWLFALSQWMPYVWQYFFLYGAALLVGIFFIGVAERRRQQAEARDARSGEEIKQLATQLERERIARDLHDVLGHSLSSIALKAELADKLLQHNELSAARQQLQELATISKDSLSQVRHSISGYRHQGLGVELQQLMQRLREQGIQVQLTGTLPELDALAESAVVLALTELVTNILRHSGASRVTIRSYSEGVWWCIEVTDNGRAGELEPGHGMRGIEERMALLDGHVIWQNGQGMRCILNLPLSVLREHSQGKQPAGTE